MYNRLQLCKHVGIRFRWIRVAAHRELDDTQSDRPYVRRDGVCAEVVLGFALDPFGLEVAHQLENKDGTTPQLTAM